MSNIFAAKSRMARLLIMRAGEKAIIYADDGSASENKYGKVSDVDKSQNNVTEELAFRRYEGGDNEPGYGEVTGGRVGTDSPRIAFFQNTQAKEGNHVEFPDGKVYELDKKFDRKTHIVFRSTLITNG